MIKGSCPNCDEQAGFYYLARPSIVKPGLMDQVAKWFCAVCRRGGYGVAA